jgi:tetratricopeptide (TPR) repeat protein
LSIHCVGGSKEWGGGTNALRMVTRRPNVWRHQADVRDALAAYQQVAATGRGQILLVAYPPSGAAGGVLQGLAELLGQAHPRPTVVGGSFTNGEYAPWPSPTRPQVPLDRLAGTISKVVDLATPAVTAAVGAPWLASAAKLLGQLAETSGAVRELVEQHARQSRLLPLGPDGLKGLLRRATMERPVACLLEDVDQASGRQVWWSQFLLPFAAEVVRDLRLLLVMSLSGPAELGAHERDEPQSLYVARRLVERDLAQWRPLQLLTVGDTSGWLHPCSPVLAARLHAATGGDPRWLGELWEDWQSRRVVHRTPDGTWQLIGPDSAGLGAISDLLDARLRGLLGTDEPARLEAARELLATAALEGLRFTAEAVAGALDRDSDEVIDFLDDTLAVSEERPDGLVVDVGFLEVQGPDAELRHLSRYQFVSTLHWRTLRRYGLGGPSEVAERSERYAWALAEVYAPQQARAASVIAELLTRAGKRRAASDFARQADFDTTPAAQRRQAFAVLEMPKDDWDDWDYVQATALLLRAGNSMLYTFPLPETLTVFEHASQLARRVDLRHEQARALFHRGEVQLWLGEYTKAERLLEAAHKLARELGDRSTVASAATRLGDVNRGQGKLTAARDYYREALDSYRLLGERYKEVETWGDLGAVDLEDGQLVDAREKLSTALQMIRDVRGSKEATASILFDLARVDLRERRFAAAAEKARESLSLDRETGNRVAESRTLHFLGELALTQGELQAASDHLGHAMELQQQLGDLCMQANTLNWLAIVAMRCGELAEARSNLLRALRFAQQCGNPQTEAEAWDRLADLAVEQDRPSASAPLRATAVLLFQRIPTREAAGAAARGYRALQELARLDPAAGNADTLLALAENAYGRDQGWGNVQAAFGPLDDLESGPPATAAKAEPPSAPM